MAAGEGALGPGIARQLITELTELLAHGPRAADEDPVRARARSAVLALTAREREVLALVGDGLTNPEIAARLHITEGTAKTHIGRLLHKLAARAASASPSSPTGPDCRAETLGGTAPREVLPNGRPTGPAARIASGTSPSNTSRSGPASTAGRVRRGGMP